MEETTTIDHELTCRLRRAGHFLYHQSGRGQQQDTVLQLLAQGPMSQKELGEHLATQGASVSELVSKLQDKGLVLRERNAADRRCVTLQLTERGIEAHRFYAKRPEDQLYAALNEDEKQQLLLLLDKLLQGWHVGGAQ